MDQEAQKKLLNDYYKNPTPELREQIILEFARLVKLVAGRMSIYLGSNVEFDDLVGYGIFGLIDAIDKFDKSKDVKFETYASLRIRGSILDHIRKMDWVPRMVRQKQRKLDSAYKQIEFESGHTPTNEQLAKVLEIDTDELAEWNSQIRSTGIVSLNEYIDSGGDLPIDSSFSQSENLFSPEAQLEKAELKEQIKQMLSALTENERMVVTLYYYEELTLKEISRIMEVSESRVSQLHTKSLQKLRIKLGDYMAL